MMKLALRDRGHRASVRSSNAFVRQPFLSTLIMLS